MTPTSNRPIMPGYGLPSDAHAQGLLAWDWAVERLQKAQTYWLATVRTDCRPHVMPVWGIWHNDHFYFSTGKASRKARNLAENPHSVVTIEQDEEAVIVEGIAKVISEPGELKSFAMVYAPKYQLDMTDFAEPVYVLAPQVAFGFKAGGDQFLGTATRWIFE